MPLALFRRSCSWSSSVSGQQPRVFCATSSSRGSPVPSRRHETPASSGMPARLWLLLRGHPYRPLGENPQDPCRHVRQTTARGHPRWCSLVGVARIAQSGDELLAIRAQQELMGLRRECRVHAIAKATSFELRYVGSSRPPRRCLCTAPAPSSGAALLLLVQSDIACALRVPQICRGRSKHERVRLAVRRLA